MFLFARNAILKETGPNQWNSSFCVKRTLVNSETILICQKPWKQENATLTDNCGMLSYCPCILSLRVAWLNETHSSAPNFWLHPSTLKKDKFHNNKKYHFKAEQCLYVRPVLAQDLKMFRTSSVWWHHLLSPLFTHSIKGHEDARLG